MFRDWEKLVSAFKACAFSVNFFGKFVSNFVLLFQYNKSRIRAHAIFQVKTADKFLGFSWKIHPDTLGGFVTLKRFNLNILWNEFSLNFLNKIIEAASFSLNYIQDIILFFLYFWVFKTTFTLTTTSLIIELVDWLINTAQTY